MKADVKDTIVAVAQKMFQHYGFRKTTMDEIARAARKGKSSLYYYFESKEDVFQAVVEKEAENLRVELAEQVAACTSAREKLRVYINVRMKGFKNWGNLYGALKDEYLANLAWIEKTRTKYDSSEALSIQNIIQQGIENKEFKPLNVKLAAKTIVVAMKGLEVPLLIESEQNSNFEAEINDMLEILFHGICP